jgi:hypothetical protein
MLTLQYPVHSFVAEALQAEPTGEPVLAASAHIPDARSQYLDPQSASFRQTGMQIPFVVELPSAMQPISCRPKHFAKLDGVPVVHPRMQNATSSVVVVVVPLSSKVRHTLAGSRSVQIAARFAQSAVQIPFGGPSLKIFFEATSKQNSLSPQSASVMHGAPMRIGCGASGPASMMMGPSVRASYAMQGPYL